MNDSALITMLMGLQDLAPCGKMEVGVWDSRPGQEVQVPTQIERRYWAAYARMRAADSKRAQTLNGDGRPPEQMAVVKYHPDKAPDGFFCKNTGITYNAIFAEVYNIVCHSMGNEGHELAIESDADLERVLKLKITM